jgi:hypothetical protein
MEKNKESIPKEKVQDSLEETGTPRPCETEGGHPVEKPIEENLLGE